MRLATLLPWRLTIVNPPIANGYGRIAEKWKFLTAIRYGHELEVRNPRVSSGPVALCPTLSDGLPFSGLYLFILSEKK